MRTRWLLFGVLALAGCASPEAGPPAVVALRSCDFTQILRSSPANGAAVPACTAPTTADISTACQATMAANLPEGRASSGLEIRAATCDYAGEGASTARCRFEQRREGETAWRVAETGFTFTYWRHDGEVDHMMWTSWRADGVCGAG